MLTSGVRSSMREEESWVERVMDDMWDLLVSESPNTSFS
jgi:hypothetical protein